MAVQRKQQDCVEHTIEINKLKSEMERIKDHEVKFNKTIERVENKVDLLNDSTLKINSALEHFKDYPERLRKLEDKSIVYDLVKVVLGIIFGLMLKDYYENRIVYQKLETPHKTELLKKPNYKNNVWTL